MSLAIDPEAVTDVLLADGRHGVQDLDFSLDSYEFVEPDGGHVLHAGGDSGICATGFKFSEMVNMDGENYVVIVAGPLSSILAVRTLTL